LRQSQYKLPDTESKTAKYPCFFLKSIRESAMEICDAGSFNIFGFHEKNGFGLTLRE
jgi:hypothetical protein